MLIHKNDVDPAEIAQAVARARAGCLDFLRRMAEHLASVKVGDDCPYELLDGCEPQVFKMMALGTPILRLRRP
ncbi:MAG: hypothetical protein ACXWC4_08660 [Telluria sp.]